MPPPGTTPGRPEGSRWVETVTEAPADLFTGIATPGICINHFHRCFMRLTKPFLPTGSQTLQSVPEAQDVFNVTFWEPVEDTKQEAGETSSGEKEKNMNLCMF